MSTIAHCLYCFEVLAAALEKREALDLAQVEALWARFVADTKLSEEINDQGHKERDGDVEMTEDEMEQEGDEDDEADIKTAAPSLRLPSILRLRSTPSGSGSSASTPSTLSATSSQAALGETSKSSSRTSFFSFSRNPAPSTTNVEEEYPLFVTWNTISSRGHKSLRGCIGTFEAHKLSSGLQSYALTSAFDDTRFSPIAPSELPSLSNDITFLMNFTPCTHPLDWDLGAHGLRLSFIHHGRRYGATYLPDVAIEQGWTKEETIISLMRKAGWSGRSSEWKKVTNLRCIKYQGKKESVDYQDWKEWRDWVDVGAQA